MYLVFPGCLRTQGNASSLPVPPAMGPCYILSPSFLVCKVGTEITSSQWYNAHGMVPGTQ